MPSNIHYYDYTNHKLCEPYRFKNDPLNNDINGEFIEFRLQHIMLISLIKLNQKLFSNSENNSSIFGDGQAIPPTKQKSSFFSKFKKTKYFILLDGHYDEKLLLRKVKKFQNRLNINFASKLMTRSH